MRRTPDLASAATTFGGSGRTVRTAAQSINRSPAAPTRACPRPIEDCTLATTGGGSHICSAPARDNRLCVTKQLRAWAAVGASWFPNPLRTNRSQCATGCVSATSHTASLAGAGRAAVCSRSWPRATSSSNATDRSLSAAGRAAARRLSATGHAAGCRCLSPTGHIQHGAALSTTRRRRPPATMQAIGQTGATQTPARRSDLRATAPGRALAAAVQAAAVPVGADAAPWRLSGVVG